MKKLIVFLHSFGYDKNECQNFQDAIKNEFKDSMYWGLNAPFPSERERGGFAWFPVSPKDRSVNLDDGNLDFSIKYIEDEVFKKLKEENLKWEDVIFIGKSQGSFLAVLVALKNKIKCSAVVCLSSRYMKCKQLEINSKPKIIWFEMEEEYANREKLDRYKLLIEKGADVKHITGKGSEHNFVSDETTKQVIEELKKVLS